MNIDINTVLKKRIYYSIRCIQYMMFINFLEYEKYVGKVHKIKFFLNTIPISLNPHAKLNLNLPIPTYCVFLLSYSYSLFNVIFMLYIRTLSLDSTVLHELMTTLSNHHRTMDMSRLWSSFLLPYEGSSSTHRYSQIGHVVLVHSYTNRDSDPIQTQNHKPKTLPYQFSKSIHINPDPKSKPDLNI